MLIQVFDRFYFLVAVWWRAPTFYYQIGYTACSSMQWVLLHQSHYFMKPTGEFVISGKIPMAFIWLSQDLPGWSLIWLTQNQPIWDLITSAKSLHLCHFLLTRSKLSVLTTLQEEIIQNMNTKGQELWGWLMGSSTVSACRKITGQAACSL